MKILILLPIIIGASLSSYANNLKDDLKYYQNPIANAGPDKTIYLTQTSTATIDGSASSADSYQWTEISTDFMSGGTITSPASKTTNVTGLKQGTFYFKLAAIAGGTTKTDTMVVRVEYDVPPANSTLIRTFDMNDPSIYTPVNDRSDTTTFFPTGNSRSSAGVDPNRYYLYRARTNGLTIDDQRGKLYSTNEDGYAGENAGGSLGNYPRSELQLCDACFKFDTTKTYVFEWKGYFPQDTNYLVNSPDWARVLTIFQVHGYKYDYAISNFDLRADGIYYNNEITGSQNELSDSYTREEAFIGSVHDFYNTSHTLRITMREGLAYPGQKAFIKVEMDGVTKYFRNTGGVGSAYFDDYVKFGSIYDWRSWITSQNSLARGRKFSLVTESFKVYQLGEAPPNTPPVADVGSDRVIQLPKNSIVLPGSATDEDGSVVSYSWSQISGPSTAIFVNPNSAQAGAGGLVAGTYQFQLKVTDDKSAAGSATLKVTVIQPGGITQTRRIGTSAADSSTMPINDLASESKPAQLKVAITAYPNPFTNLIVVNITGDAGSYSLSLTDALGRTLLTKKGNKNAETYQETINTSKVANGIYFLTVIQNNNISTIKMKK